MPQHQPQHQRYDGYGRPIVPLTDACVESLVERPANQRVRQLLYRHIEALWDTLLRRGTYADVAVQFRVRDGLLLAEVRVGVTQRHRAQPEEE